MTAAPRLLGMVHLLPLPGAPAFAGSMDEVVSTAVADAESLIDAGFPALMIENFGDAPFWADSVPAETVAAMTLATAAVRNATGVPHGVNVLRNDALSAIGVAAVTGAALVRVNVLTGTMYTDQGPIVGKAAEVARLRQHIAPSTEIWADVMVKHATAPAGADAGQLAADTIERGKADAIVFSGSGTGAEPDLEDARRILEAVPEGTRIVAGSGTTPENLSRTLEVADTVIVGSSVKVDGHADNRVDPARAAAVAEAARENGLI